MRRKSTLIRLLAVFLMITISVPAICLPSELQDDARATAERLLAEADKLREMETADSCQAAIKKYEEALAICRKLGERNLEAQALYGIGAAYALLDDAKQAMNYYQQALQGYQAVGNRRGEAGSLKGIAVSKSGAAKYQEALADLNRALDIARSIKDRKLEAEILHDFAPAYAYMGQLSNALEVLEQALAILREIGYHKGEAAALDNLGTVSKLMRRYQQALDYLTQSLKVSRDIGDELREGKVLGGIGSVYLDSGDFEKALSYHTQARSIFRKLGNKSAEADSLTALALVYSYSNNHQKAIEHNLEALRIFQELQKRYEVVQLTSNLGAIYDRLGDRKKAAEYLAEALRMAREFGIRIGELHISSILASVYISLNELSKAEELIRDALVIALEVGDTSRRTELYFHQVLIEVKRDNLVEALRHNEAAISLTETVADGIPNLDARSKFLAQYRTFHSSYIDLLMRMHQRSPNGGYAAAALKAAEATKARSLLSLLVAARVDLSKGVDPKLLERERVLRQMLAVKQLTLDKLRGSRQSQEQAAPLEKEIALISEEYNVIKGKIFEASPEYASITRPKSLELADIQKLLDENTVLVEYNLGVEKAYLWLVTPTSISGHQLPPKGEIREQAKKVYDLLTERSKISKGESPKTTRARWQKADNDYPAAANKLSEMILGPIASQLGKKRLVIVADGALQYIPFAALPAPTTEGQTDPKAKPVTPSQSSFTPLIAGHEVINLPSATTLAVLRQQFGERKPAQKAVAVLADPVFDKCDPRVLKQTASNTIGAKDCTPSQAEAARAWRDLNPEDGSITPPRLPRTRGEAKAITALVPPNAHKQALDFEANREMATSEELGKYRIVHFATHGFLNPSHPERSGIVLSLVNEKGEEQNGFLSLRDVYSLKLSANLVVLSACRTSLGTQIEGEGVISLARGFMSAGVPRVIATLWKVDDDPSAELMKSLYTQMLRGKRLSPGAALRAAQLEMRKNGEFSSPFYWAAFILQGEYQ
jgi:CHAT domain-containing protein